MNLGIRKHLSRNSTETLIHAFVSSRLDYCNSLLYGLPQAQIDKIQRVQNAAARLIFKQLKFSHITPVLYQLHWLAIKYRIEFKILLFTFKAIHGMAPDYICKLISRKSSTRHSLRSTAKELCLRFLVARSSQHLDEEHFVMQPRTSGTICSLKYLALTHSQVLSTTTKQILLNNLLICKSYIFYFRQIFIVSLIENIYIYL